MKKLVIILICITLIIGIGLGVLKKKEKQFSIESILPQEALVYVQIRDVAKNFQKLELLPFWQSIRDINYELLMEKNAINDQQLVFINLIKKQLSHILSSPLSKRLFGQEVAFAVYSPEMDLNELVREMKILSPKFFEELLSGFYLVTRVDPDVQFAEFISRFFDQFGTNITQNQLEYNGEVVRTVTVSDIGMTFSVVRLRDLLVIGVGKKAARISVDVFKGEKPALAQDPQFEQILSRALDPSHMVGFFNFEPFLKILKSQGAPFIDSSEMNTADANVKAQWETVLAKMSGIKALGFSTQLSPIMRIDNYFIFDPMELSAEYAPLYTCPSEENKTIRFIPKEVLGYQWSNCFKLDYYWKQINKELEQKGASSSRIDEMETKIGMSIERDILPAFGEEIGGYIQDIQVGGFFPIPKLLLFIEIRNRTKAEQLLEKLKDQPMVNFQEENYQGISLKYLALPLGQDVQPGYAFLENYFLISTSRQLIRDSIDALQNNSLSLLASPDFKEIDFGLTDKNRYVQYLKIGKFVEKVKGVINWSNQWTSARNRKTQAFKAGSEKPLEEVEASIAAKENELMAIRDKVILVEDQIWNMESKGLDIGVQQNELHSLKSQLDAKKEEIVSENERKAGLASIIQEYEESSPEPELRQLYLDEIIYPVLESLKSIKSYGLRSTINDNVFESSIFLNVAN